MNRTVDIQHIEIVLSVRQLRPTVLSSDLLKAEGVVPSDWEIVELPTYIQQGIAEEVGQTEVPFQNGVCMTYKTQGIAFLEDLRHKAPEGAEIPQIAQQYIQKFPQENYFGVSINFKGYVIFDAQNDVRRYLAECLLNPNNCHETDQSIAHTGFHFRYYLDRCLLNLDIRNISEQGVLGLEFSAHFSYHYFSHRLSELAQAEQFHVLSQTISNWQTDLDTYTELVNKRFLGQKNQP